MVNSSPFIYYRKKVFIYCKKFSYMFQGRFPNQFLEFIINFLILYIYIFVTTKLQFQKRYSYFKKSKIQIIISVIRMAEYMNTKVGEAAGVLYHRLEEGECSLNQIKNHLSMNGFDTQMALMAIGWLAREDKISLKKESNRWSVWLN